MTSASFADRPSMLILLGGLIAAGSAFWSAFLQDREGRKGKFGAAMLILVGALIGIVGSHWSYIQQVEFQRDTLGAVTGGNSFCVMLPTRNETRAWPLTVVNEGKYPLHAVTFEIFNASAFHFEPRLVAGSLGTLRPQLAELTRYVLPISNEPSQAFQISIFARNDSFVEYLYLARLPDHWAIAAELFRNRDHKKLWEVKDKDFPPDWKLLPPKP